MPQVAMRAFKAALEQRKPDAVYLLHGDNEFLKDEKVRSIVDTFVEPATRDFNYEFLRGAEIDGKRLSTALDALPLMASLRVIVLHDIGALKEDSRTVLDRYLARPAADTVLVLVAMSGWKSESSTMDRASTLEARPLTEDETIKWTMSRAEFLDSTIEEDAARLLVLATGAELALIDGELRKLRDYTCGTPIGIDAVDAIVGLRAGETMGDLLDAACARDAVKAAGLVGLVLGQPKASGASLVMALTTQMLGIGHVLMARQSGAVQKEIASELYAMLGDSRSAVVGRPWGEAVSAWTRHASRWDERAVTHALATLRDGDRALKDSGLSGEEQSIATVMLTMCHQRRSPRS